MLTLKFMQNNFYHQRNHKSGMCILLTNYKTYFHVLQKTDNKGLQIHDSQRNLLCINNIYINYIKTQLLHLNMKLHENKSLLTK